MYAILFMVIAFSVVAAITLFKLIAEYSRSNNSFKPTPLRGAA